MPIKKCPECGSTEFYISETVGHKATVDKDGNLNAYKCNFNQIDEITCAKCHEVLDEADFDQINF